MVYMSHFDARRSEMKFELADKTRGYEMCTLFCFY